MQITSGSRIGHYAVVDTLGAGGMGHVYRANDQRLGRDVAIKTLPDDLALHPAALARFEREARFLAALNHPNIAAIYGIEEHERQRFLILELVDGETLDAIIARGRLSVDESLRIAIEISSALEAAHASGIVHRDLKPSNVKITPAGRVKLLDFGIAKHLDPEGREGRGENDDTQLTRGDVVLGTPAYMSPEQLLNEDIDRGTDVWALGCLLYEMLSGQRAFQGGSFIELADAIRNTDPGWHALPRDTPEQLRRLLAQMLRKDPGERLRDVAIVRKEFEAIRNGGRSGSGLSRVTVAALAAAAAIILVVAWRAWPDANGSPTSPPRLVQLTSDAGVEQFPAWSADGQSIVYAADAGGVRKLYIRRIGSPDARQITTGEFDDVQPAWFPDGRRIVFVRAREANRRMEPVDVFGMFEAQGDLFTVDVSDGRVRKLLEHAYYPSVSPDGRAIAFDASWAGPRRIWIADARGFNPRQVTSDSSEAVNHVLPRWSPDGRRLVYQRIENTRFDIATVEVASGASRQITNDIYREFNPAFGRDGRSIVFSSDRGGGINVWRLDLARSGQPTGSPHQLTLGAGQDVQLAVSPDGSRLVYATLRQNADLWRLPLSPDGRVLGQPERLVETTTEDSRGAWSPDGRHIAFNSDRGGDMNIWVYSLDDRSTRQVTRGQGGDFQAQWSPDGRQLVFFSSRGGNANIWKVDIASGALTQLTRGHALDVNPFWSPDGREIVYQSDSSGRLELWVTSADGASKRQLTTVGVYGHFSQWTPDGVYFRNPAGSGLMRVPGAGGEPQFLSPNGGAHVSFSPDRARWIDVSGHRVLWIYNTTNARQKLFEFPDDSRIDYPVWSRDGRWLLFDRFRPEGGDLWLAEGIR